MIINPISYQNKLALTFDYGNQLYNMVETKFSLVLAVCVCIYIFPLTNAKFTHLSQGDDKKYNSSDVSNNSHPQKQSKDQDHHFERSKKLQRKKQTKVQESSSKLNKNRFQTYSNDHGKSDEQLQNEKISPQKSQQSKQRNSNDKTIKQQKSSNVSQQKGKHKKHHKKNKKKIKSIDQQSGQLNDKQSKQQKQIRKRKHKQVQKSTAVSKSLLKSKLQQQASQQQSKQVSSQKQSASQSKLKHRSKHGSKHKRAKDRSKSGSKSEEVQSSSQQQKKSKVQEQSKQKKDEDNSTSATNSTILPADKSKFKEVLTDVAAVAGGVAGAGVVAMGVGAIIKARNHHQNLKNMKSTTESNLELEKLKFLSSETKQSKRSRSKKSKSKFVHSDMKIHEFFGEKSEREIQREIQRRRENMMKERKNEYQQEEQSQQKRRQYNRPMYGQQQQRQMKIKQERLMNEENFKLYLQKHQNQKVKFKFNSLLSHQKKLMKKKLQPNEPMSILKNPYKQNKNFLKLRSKNKRRTLQQIFRQEQKIKKSIQKQLTSLRQLKQQQRLYKDILSSTPLNEQVADYNPPSPYVTPKYKPIYPNPQPVQKPTAPQYHPYPPFYPPQHPQPFYPQPYPHSYPFPYYPQNEPHPYPHPYAANYQPSVPTQMQHPSLIVTNDGHNKKAN